MEDGAAPPGLSSAAGAPRRGWWVDKDDEDAVYLTVLMLGLGKERVKVWAERNILVIKGGGEKAHRKGDSNPALSRYSHRIEMPAGEYKMDKIKAEMKNFVLKVTVPKLKEEERMDVFQVTIEYGGESSSRSGSSTDGRRIESSSGSGSVHGGWPAREDERCLVGVVTFGVFLPCFASSIVLDRGF
ncbi:26.2 kDa heat shock protein, mitochondrial-like [Triticum urartu]|uniref:26.2 kDa heat shock protein, mitochondrial-like n=1 Tax=Triticum urartu TaxID=4572 RepID=UPI002042D13A|nr:26.2 kDa heat shock protein, mitochondrial-like [Triticum urartu]XP_048545456.1 26.2 kDa heat shock protein, mitochondrial-like [Triticum urartu]